MTSFGFERHERSIASNRLVRISAEPLTIARQNYALFHSTMVLFFYRIGGTTAEDVRVSTHAYYICQGTVGFTDATALRIV